MDIVTIVIALILIFIAWKVLMGFVKFGVIAVVIIAAIYFLSTGALA
ncbi:MAG: hypothetical protein WA948_09695 [Pontixanthobacter sp.]